MYMISERLGVVIGFFLVGVCGMPQVADAALSSEHFVLDSYKVGGDLGTEETASEVYTIYTSYGTEYIVAGSPAPEVPESEEEVTAQQGSRRRLTDETEFIGGGTTTPITRPSLLGVLREAQDPRLSGIHERAFELAHGVAIAGNIEAVTQQDTEGGEGSTTEGTSDRDTNGLAAEAIQSGTPLSALFASFWARFGLLLLVLIVLWYVRTRTMFGKKYGPF